VNARGRLSGARHAAAGVLAAARALLILTAGPVAAAPAAPAPAAVDRSLGDPRAPVTVIEYASVGCPHCADWANDVFPLLRKKYIDTGQVRFELHEMLTGSPNLAAAGFLLARCAAPDKYFQVVDDIYAQQGDIVRGGVDVLAKVGEHAGVDREHFDACLRDSAALEALNARTLADAQAHGVSGTPTFFIGTERLDGEQPLEALEAAIARARR
jgi:protein-disulfide isomerase